MRSASHVRLSHNKSFVLTGYGQPNPFGRVHQDFGDRRVVAHSNEQVADDEDITQRGRLAPRMRGMTLTRGFALQAAPETQ